MEGEVKRKMLYSILVNDKRNWKKLIDEEDE
jgi:hypothetical protein